MLASGQPGMPAHVCSCQCHIVPIYGIVDSGADITIIGSAMFKNRNIWPADRMLYSYDRKPLKLNGRMYLEISLGGKTVTTPAYIKMDANNPHQDGCK